MFKLVEVFKSFPDTKQGLLHAVHGVSLHIIKGEIFGLMGYSGAGKSTLLRLLNLLERPDRGQVFFLGQDLMALSNKELRLARQQMGMVFQQFNLMANWSVFDNVAYALKVANYPKHLINKRVMECLEVVQLAEKAKTFPAQLSGGQKQRVAIARALAPNPKAILADEPTSALDPLTTRSVLDCLQKINREFGVSIAIVTHEMAVIRTLCHRAALLNDGRLLEIIEVKDGRFTAQTEVGRMLTMEI